MHLPGSSATRFWFIAILAGATMTAILVGGIHAIQTPAEWERGLHGFTVAQKTLLTLAITVAVAAAMVAIQRLNAPATLASAIGKIRWLVVVSVMGFTLGLTDAPPTRWQDTMARYLLLVASLLVSCACVYWLRTTLEPRENSPDRKSNQ